MVMEVLVLPPVANDQRVLNGFIRSKVEKGVEKWVVPQTAIHRPNP